MIADALIVAVAVTVLLAFGYALLRLLAPRAPLWWFERLAFSFLLGAGGASIAWMLLLPIYDVVQPRWALLVAGSGALIWAWPRLRSARDRSSRSQQAINWVTLAGSVVLLFQFATLMAASVHGPLGWDALFNFEFKARLAFEHRPPGQLPLAYFSDPSRAWSHPRYPLLLPFVEFWVYSWLGRVDQAALKWFLPLFDFALIAGVCGTVRRLTNVPVAFATGIALGLLPTMTVDPGAITGYADVPVAAAMAGALCCTVLAIQTEDGEPLRLAGGLAAVAALTKVEGLLLAMFFGVAAPLLGISAGKRAAAIAPLWVPLLVMVPWLVFQHRYGLPEADFPSLSPLVALRNLPRLPVTASLIARELLKPGRWALVWPAFGAALALAMWRGTLSGVSAMLAAGVLLPLAAYTVIFLFSGWGDFTLHVGTSIGRLLMPLAPTALVFTASQLWSST